MKIDNIDNIKPIAGGVLICIKKEEPNSSLSIPDTYKYDKKEVEIGEIIKVGPYADEVKVGDKIVFLRYGIDSHQFELNKKEYAIVSEDDILALLE